jgi:hypothetical protein
MAKFKYTGQDDALVGRFGRLKRGTIVELWQTEAEYVESHGSVGWSRVKETGNIEGVGTILPAKTLNFDFTRTHWPTDMLYSMKRMSRPDLIHAALGLNSMGADIPGEKDLHNMSKEALFAAIYGELKRLRWDQPGYGPNGEAPASPPSNDIICLRCHESKDMSEFSTPDLCIKCAEVVGVLWKPEENTAEGEPEDKDTPEISSDANYRRIQRERKTSHV